jgi:CheY-like chemotaxis protein
MNIPLRVLVVDDSEDDAKLMIRQLHKGGSDPKWEMVETTETPTGMHMARGRRIHW